jgi:dienelactone hydrolase
MTRRSLSLGAVLLGLSALSQGSVWAQAPAPQVSEVVSSPEEVLTYKAAQTAEVKVVGTEHKAGTGVIVEDVTFPSAMGAQPTQAYIVKPDSGSGPWAGVLFVHWFAPPDPTSNRTQYLDEAKELARRGTVSILPSTFWSEEARYSARKWENDYQQSVDQAKDLRRALDVLLAQPGVDPKRIGVVGHDYGAMFSSVAMTADTRPKALVFIAGTARFPDWYLFGSASGVPKGKDLDDFRARFSAIDPITAVAKIKVPIFFQFGETDVYTPRDNFLELYKAAAGPKRIATYPSKHEMNAEIIRHDRTVWLAEQLGLSK